MISQNIRFKAISFRFKRLLTLLWSAVPLKRQKRSDRKIY